MANQSNYQGSYAQTTGYKAPPVSGVLKYTPPKQTPAPVTTKPSGKVNPALVAASIAATKGGNAQQVMAAYNSGGGQVLGASTFNGASAPVGASNIGAGQSLGSSQSLSLPSTNVVNTSTLSSQNTKLALPTLTPTVAPTIIPLAPLDQQVKDAQDKSATDFQKYLDSIIAPPSSADAYQKAQNETGILQKQQTVNNLTGQLNSIVATGEANKLSLVGQGRGIPEAIIGGQQAEIGRETAIQALPVQAQLSAAQGDLQMANENLNTLFKIYSDDAKNAYDYKTKINEAVYQFADKQNQAKLQELQKKQQQQHDEEQAFIKQKQDIAMQAVKGGASASAISSIAKSTDFASALKAASPYMLDTQTVKLDNGNTVVIDSNGRVIKNLGGAKSTTNNSNFIVTKDTLKNTYGNDVVSLIAGTIKASGAKQSQSTNDAINVISGLQQLVKDNPEGVFAGLAPIRLLPSKFKSTQALTNLSDVEAINLKVQQWASGAALTEQQTKQVAKITPQKGDTDQQVMAKTNALANYMVSQVSGQLAGQGIGFAIDKVDLFTKTPEQELKTLYQNPALKQKIQQAVQMFPTYTDAEILQIVQ